jgi:hypothetical protein
MADLAQEQNKEIDTVISAYAGEQLVCMYLQYAAGVEIKKDIKKGMIMLEAVEKIRNLLNEKKKEMESVLGGDAISASFERIGFLRKIYPRLTDAMIESNSKYFGISLRPQGAEYGCDDAACNESAFMLAYDYFPSLYDNAA